MIDTLTVWCYNRKKKSTSSNNRVMINIILMTTCLPNMVCKYHDFDTVHNKIPRTLQHYQCDHISLRLPYMNIMNLARSQLHKSCKIQLRSLRSSHDLTQVNLDFVRYKGRGKVVTQCRRGSTGAGTSYSMLILVQYTASNDHKI